GALLLFGEPGVGKTALLDAAAMTAAAAGRDVGRGGGGGVGGGPAVFGLHPAPLSRRQEVSQLQPAHPAAPDAGLGGGGGSAPPPRRAERGAGVRRGHYPRSPGHLQRNVDGSPAFRGRPPGADNR